MSSPSLEAPREPWSSLPHPHSRSRVVATGRGLPGRPLCLGAARRRTSARLSSVTSVDPRAGLALCAQPHASVPASFRSPSRRPSFLPLAPLVASRRRRHRRPRPFSRRRDRGAAESNRVVCAIDIRSQDVSVGRSQRSREELRGEGAEADDRRSEREREVRRSRRFQLPARVYRRNAADRRREFRPPWDDVASRFIFSSVLSLHRRDERVPKTTTTLGILDDWGSERGADVCLLNTLLAEQTGFPGRPPPRTSGIA